jgi:hypothetical protein
LQEFSDLLAIPNLANDRHIQRNAAMIQAMLEEARPNGARC